MINFPDMDWVIPAFVIAIPLAIWKIIDIVFFVYTHFAITFVQ
jgi:hypothetical protein